MKKSTNYCYDVADTRRPSLQDIVVERRGFSRRIAIGCCSMCEESTIDDDHEDAISLIFMTDVRLNVTMRLNTMNVDLRVLALARAHLRHGEVLFVAFTRNKFPRNRDAIVTARDWWRDSERFPGSIRLLLMIA
ncbi:hypothetical protein HN011_007190 [Eciton burchellii]|jgi:hypothetical protein|nr:hypothetical protein HN011_007190 [Eciton burchellii]